MGLQAAGGVLSLRSAQHPDVLQHQVLRHEDGGGAPAAVLHQRGASVQEVLCAQGRGQDGQHPLLAVRAQQERQRYCTAPPGRDCFRL